MSEPTRTSAHKRAKLALALKRNMARRKAVVSRQSPVASEVSPVAADGERIAFRGEPLAAGGQRSVGDEESPSINGNAS